MGKYANLEVAAQTVELTETYLPGNASHATYAKYFNIFDRLTRKLAEEFEDIAMLQQQNK